MYVSELFHSLQGEGPSMGKPSVFLRFSGCNLFCEWCDTEEVMDMDCTTEMDIKEVVGMLIKYRKEYFQSFLTLVITGGEPLLYENEIIEVLDILEHEGYSYDYVEIETNGTYFPETKLCEHISQFNVSPKLKSAKAGDKELYYQPSILEDYTALARVDKTTKVIFKFVIGDGFDFEDMTKNYLPYIRNIRDNIWLMPQGSSRKELNDTYPFVANLAIQHGFNFSGRLHVNIWDLKTGV